MKVKEITFIAIMTALLCALAPISIPMYPVPITLATFVVYLIASLFDFKKTSIIILIYLLLGTLGVPIFSNFTGGLQKLMGPTGGYLIGYLLGGIVQSIMVEKGKDNPFMYPLSMTVSTIVIYTFGTAWFMILMKGAYTFEKTLMACVIPFIVGDTIKIVLASLTSIKLKSILKRKELI